MLRDFCRFAGVTRFETLFPRMPEGWARHFDRYEWTGAVDLASNHIRVSDRFSHPPLEAFEPERLTVPSIVIPYQGLIVNGWADPVAAAVFVDALNAHALDQWAGDNARIALVINPHDPNGSAETLKAHRGDSRVGAITIPLTTAMLGQGIWDPVYRVVEEANWPVIIHFSGVEGAYLGAPPLAGAPHTNALSRHILMPHLAESNLASLVFEGTFYRFPRLQVVLAGFGFKWLPSLLRRMDQEWRNFRSDMPWVKDKPSAMVMRNVWVTTYPAGEATRPDTWEGEFSDELSRRLVFSSNAPFDSDDEQAVEAALGGKWLDRIASNSLELSGIVAAGR
ncbi:amidohydrolase family protein [Chelatococcus asaccharovorans]|uniref:Amidohydrolase family protein n=1 Tax=Chelatococcus asaccharovorans TaxID=28210 RepID=A0A2V3U8H5_9HYPH|nr:amidohydrolase family protein [Chelatococcus asaccharovorans]MBS7705480.1 amidohydrolase family protein [Chelatococcus asaccharovorans]PXW60115.1 amidohydrolase family protein [Chelatococcus asaccharovorans]